MLGSNNFFTDFVWVYRQPIFAIALILPIAWEGVSACYEAFKDKSFHEGVKSLKERLLEPFKKKDDESDLEHKVRVTCNVLQVALITLGIITLIAAPYVVLPGSATIFLALTILSVAGTIYLHRKDIQDLPNKISNWFKAPAKEEGETPEAYKIRCVKHYAIKALYIGAAVAAIGLTAFLTGTFLYNLSLGQGVFEASQTIPLVNSVAFTCTLYAALGIAHLKVAYDAWKEKSYGKAFLYFCTGLLSAFAPLLGQILIPSEPIRIHHTAIGAAMMLLPTRALKILGTFIALDGFSYFLAHPRGYQDGWWFELWDFMNLIIDNIHAFIAAYSLSVYLETIRKKSREEKELEEKANTSTTTSTITAA